MQKKLNYPISRILQPLCSIHYEVLGQGEPVVLLHGFGEDSSVWDSLIPGLEKNYKLIIPDLPGSGYSTFLKKDRVIMIDYAHCLKAILDKEKIKKCTVIGHSMGGYITMAFAEKYPTCLKAYGLFSSTAVADSAEKKETRNKAISFIKENGAEAFLKTAIPNQFADVKKSKKLIEQQLEKGKKFENKALVQYYRAMIARPDRTNVLKRSTVPVLFIFGENDNLIALEEGLKLTSLPQQAHVHVLKNSGHMGMLEEPKESIKILNKFLQEA